MRITPLETQPRFDAGERGVDDRKPQTATGHELSHASHKALAQRRCVALTQAGALILYRHPRVAERLINAHPDSLAGWPVYYSILDQIAQRQAKDFLVDAQIDAINASIHRERRFVTSEQSGKLVLNLDQQSRER